MSNSDDRSLEDSAGEDRRLSEFVQRLREIPLSEVRPRGFSTGASSSSRDRLIYDCGFAAGAESARRSQVWGLRRNRLLSVAAAGLAIALGAYAWQTNSRLNVLAQQQQVLIASGSAQSGAPLTRDTAKDLAAVWVAAQSRAMTDVSDIRWLTPKAQTIEMIDKFPAAPSISTEQAPTSTPLRSKDFQSLLDFEV